MDFLRFWVRQAACTALAVALAACGGGAGGGDSVTSPGRAGTDTGPTSGTGTGSGGTGAGSGSGNTGGGGSTPTTPVPDPATVVLGERQAARLLTQATFGPTLNEIARVAPMTAAQYVDEQLAKPATHHLDECRAAPNGSGKIDVTSRYHAWWKTAITGDDQLRQRVALALSEIMVVSQTNSFLNDQQEGLCYYYDILVDRAFGNYRELLGAVTLSPEMGKFLSMMGSKKPDPSTGRRADENFGREVMQLFSIGLSRLNLDGTLVLDAAGNPIDTYSQTDVENMARAFTGWTFGNATSPSDTSHTDYLNPMRAYEAVHDTDAKTLVGGVVVGAGGTAASDLAAALDALGNHANTAPFISRQLIQRLVTSNPSPAYVKRVASVFVDDGRGVRGNLGAVVRAILLDRESLLGVDANADFGKVREPLLRQTHLWRALDAKASVNGYYHYMPVVSELGQMALGAGSVFNFFRPDFSPQGDLRDAGLVAPEYQLANDTSLPTAANRLYSSLGVYVGKSGVSDDAILVDYAALKARAADPQQLIDTLDLLLMSGQMPADFKAALVGYAGGVPTDSDGGLARILDTVYLTMASPQYLIQR